MFRNRQVDAVYRRIVVVGVTLVASSLLATLDPVSARLEDLAQATATPECVPPIPRPHLVLGVRPSEVRVGERITLTVEHVNLGLPRFYFRSWPAERIVTDPPLASPCNYEEHPNGCEELTFRARAAGAVTITGQAT